MHNLWMLVTGATVGGVAVAFMPGWSRGGTFLTMLLGIGGSFLAGYVGRSFGWDEGIGIVLSIAGALGCLFLYQLVIGGRSGPA